MAATYATATKTVFGDKRVIAGIIHMNDGGPTSFNIGGLKRVDCVIFSVNSAASTAILKLAQKGSTAGNVYVGTCASGDAFNFMVMGK